MKLIVVGFVLLQSWQAQAQHKATDQTTVYGKDGKVQNRITTDSQGSQTVYDSSGRVTGRTSTDSQGTTYFYDASGNRVGSATRRSK